MEIKKFVESEGGGSDKVSFCKKYGNRLKQMSENMSIIYCCNTTQLRHLNISCDWKYKKIIYVHLYVYM